jgi:hypothetical protein
VLEGLGTDAESSAYNKSQTGNSDNLTAIREPTLVWTMWDPRHPTSLWAPTACCGGSFTRLIVFIACCVQFSAWCVIPSDAYFSVLCLIVLALLPGKNQFTVQLHDNTTTNPRF